jgi:hypothetical protein
MELWFVSRSQFHLLRTSGALNEYNATTEIGPTKVEMTWYIPTFILDYAKNNCLHNRQSAFALMSDQWNNHRQRGSG